jgi:hypothetical protein
VNHSIDLSAWLERLGQPEDIASVVSFLAGLEGGWVNAQVLRANGGFASGLSVESATDQTLRRGYPTPESLDGLGGASWGSHSHGTTHNAPRAHCSGGITSVEVRVGVDEGPAVPKVDMWATYAFNWTSS